MFRRPGRKRLIASARIPHIGALSGVEMTQTAMLPPLRRTRRNSASPRAGLGKNCKPSWHMTRSKLASLNGNAWPSPATGQNNGSFNRARAPSSIAGEMSAPITKPDAPTIGSAPSAASPVPVETSSTLDPGATSAAPSTDGIKSRDHRPVKRSYAEASTARPGATWKPAPKFVLITASHVFRTRVNNRLITRISRWHHYCSMRAPPKAELNIDGHVTPAARSSSSCAQVSDDGFRRHVHILHQHEGAPTSLTARVFA